MISTRKSRQEGFAILMVVLVLVGLAIIGAPFAISMRQEEQTSITFAGRVRAKLAAQAALTYALYQLEQAHQYNEAYNAQYSLPTIYNAPFANSNGDFQVSFQDPALSDMETANPAGVMWAIQVTDEQSKINLKTASRALLYNLFIYVLPARAATLADAIINYRDVQRKPFTALTQLREVPVAPLLAAAEYDTLVPYLTVHSASLVGDVSSHSLALHPVNINTCSEPVLRALLLGLKLLPQPGVTQAQGVTAAEVDNLIRRLRVFPTLSAPVARNAASVPLSGAAGLPAAGWIDIEGDAVKYFQNNGSSLAVTLAGGKSNDPNDPTPPVAAAVDEDHPHSTDTPLDQVQVRLLFTSVETDLANVLSTMVANNELSADSSSAILANAINPLNAAALDITTTTAPLSFRSFNIYTLDAHGISSAPDGRELARYSIREVAQVNPCGELQLKVDTQEEFARSLQAGNASHVTTWPNATQVSDIPPASIEPTDPTLVYRKGRIGMQAAKVTLPVPTNFAVHVNGPLERNTLRALTLDDTNMADPNPTITTVKVDPGLDSDLEPEGIYVGEETDPTTGQPTVRRTLAYNARNDTDMTKSSIPQGPVSIQPFVIEMWVKFPSPTKFDYGRDHFLLDLAQSTFTNRVALYYDSTGPNGGDIVLYVCGPTLQPTPTQVRYSITSSTFEPQRWYHVAIVVKGSDYGQMALLIDGANVGRFEPSALLAGGLGATDTSIACDRLAPFSDPSIYFAPYTWPQEDCVIIDGELIEHVAANGTMLTVRTVPYAGRGARGTLNAVHTAGAHVELYGYDDTVVPAYNDTSLPLTLDHLPRQGEVATLLASDKLPATMALATVDDGFAGTASGTTGYWKPNPDPTVGYAAVAAGAPTNQGSLADLTDNVIPPDGWLPITHSSPPMIIQPASAGGSLADDPANFNQAAQDTLGVMAAFLAFKDPSKSLSTTTRTIEDKVNGLGFLTVEGNPGAANGTGEIIKYAKAGVVLVWQWNPADLGKKEADRQIFAWYVGYLANFGDGTGKTTYGRRACFSTTQADINEGATLRFNCLRLSGSQGLPLGRQGPRPPVKIGPIDVPVGNYGGLGIFQLFHDLNTYEWVQFSYPEFNAQADELALLQGVGSSFFVGITRSTFNTGPTPTTPDAHTGYAFAAGDQIMPVFFGGGSITSSDNQNLPIIKGRSDRVTLTDITKLSEEHYLSYGSGPYFAFRDQVGGVYLFNNQPRVLKFPSGDLPAPPDLLLYVGSDAMYHNSQPKAAFSTAMPFTEGGSGISPLTSPAEPERPANATVDEIKIYPSSSHPTARLWDYKNTGGAPDPNVAQRGFAPVGANDKPPFYVRIGRLERLTMAPVPTAQNPNPPIPLPFRFVIGGETDWPMDGYCKIDDEVLFYRKMYYNRNGGHSAAIVSDRGAGADGLATALTASDTDLYVDATSGDDFPELGYITMGGGWPNPQGWQNLINTSTQYGVDPATLAKLGGGYFGLTSSVGAPERAFFQRLGRTTKNGKAVWHLQLLSRGIVDTTPAVVKFVPAGTTPPWFVPGATDPGGGSVSVVGIEFLILQRACLGTVAAPHPIGTVLMPLDHIPTSLAPRPLVRLKRGVDGKLQRLTAKPDTIRGLRPGDADYTAFDITKPGYEYGILVEDVDQFPTEGYVQIGNEIFAYIQDRDGANPNIPNSGTPIWNAEVMVFDQAQGTDVPKIMPLLTGIRDFRQRFGSGRAVYMEKNPGDAGALTSLDPGIPDPNKNPGDAGYKTQPIPPYWTMNAKHIVRSIAYRYYDRFPLRVAGVNAPWDPASESTGGYGPHWNDVDLGYYEFAVSLPGARWTSVHWAEALYRATSNPPWALDNTPLSTADPFAVRILAQIDGSPGWDDMTPDPTAPLVNGVAQPVSSPVYWADFTSRADVYNTDSTSHRPLKPVITLFGQASDPTNLTGQPGNFIDPYTPTTTAQSRGQYGDRIRLRVFFQYRKNLNPDRDNSDAVPFYQIPWRTPWVDWITLGYSGPTSVMEHREMPY